MICLCCKKEEMATGILELMEQASISGSLPIVCEQCRADRALGAAVRAMAEGWRLVHGFAILDRETGRWYADWHDNEGEPHGVGSTPEEALRTAGLMK